MQFKVACLSNIGDMCIYMNNTEIKSLKRHGYVMFDKQNVFCCMLMGAFIQSMPCPLIIIKSNYSNVSFVLMFFSMDFDLCIKSMILKYMIKLINQIFVFSYTFHLLLTSMIHLREYGNKL